MLFGIVEKLYDLCKRRHRLDLQSSLQTHIPESTPDTWCGVSRLQGESQEAAEIINLFNSQCASHSSKYPFALNLEEIYRVDPQNHGRSCTTGQQSKLCIGGSQHAQLFHGTSLKNMKSIIANGFRLPSRPGMFGKGIYFADTPLKSWQYSTSKTCKYLLVVDVALGKVKKQLQAYHIDPQKDLQHRWFMGLFKARNYDSVVAVTRQRGGCVNVPEYVVYTPNQASVRFIIKCSEVAM